MAKKPEQPKETFEIQHPWTLLDFEYEPQYIKWLQERIGPKHPLSKKRLYVFAVRKDPRAVIFETVKQPTVYVWVSLESNRKNPKSRVLKDLNAIRELMAKDAAEWVAWATSLPGHVTIKPPPLKSSQ